MTLPALLRLSLLCLATATLAVAQDTTPLAEADARYRTGAFGEAAKLYRVALEKDPANQTVQASLVKSLLYDNAVDEAFSEVLKAAKASPRNATLRCLVGDVMYRMAEFEAAERHYRTALELDPKHARALHGLSIVLGSNFQHKSALEYLRQAHQADPEDGTIRYEYEQSQADRKTWILQGEPKQSEIKLTPMYPQPNHFVGFKLAAAINGVKLTLQLDSGAGGILLRKKAADRLRLEPLPSGFLLGIGDKGKLTRGNGLAKSVRIGEVEFHDCPISFSEQKEILDDIDGLIGVSVLRQFLIVLDLPRNRMELRPLPPIGGKPYDDPSTWNQLDRTAIPELASLTPVRNSGHLLVQVTANNKKRGYFILDTGAAEHLVSVRFLREATEVGSSTMEVRGLSGTVDKVFRAPLPVELSFGRFRQQVEGLLAIDMSKISRDEGVEISGLLGHTVLGVPRITIDYRDGLVGFGYFGGK